MKMRKHDVRKWIHAVLDMLPLFIIPIFAIYMHRHPVTNYEVETGGYEITEKYTTNDVNSLDDLHFDSVYHCDFLPIGNYDAYLDIRILSLNNFDSFFDSSYFSVNEVYVDNYDSTFSNYILLVVDASDCCIQFTNESGYTSLCCDLDDFSFVIYDFDFIMNDYINDYVNNVNSFDEVYPTFSSSNFQSYDYEYNEGLTYDDTDIGSQFVYALYLPIEKYFNFNNVATFNNMYQWFTTNFFNGNVPLVVPIVWNIILYEFIMDILFLIYAVFMFIIDFVECLIDKAFGKSYRGGR